MLSCVLATLSTIVHIRALRGLSLPTLYINRNFSVKVVSSRTCVRYTTSLQWENT